MAKKINENELSKAVALREGGKKNLSIGQIKEVQKHLLDQLAAESKTNGMAPVVALVEKHK